MKLENLLTLNDMINNALSKFADIVKGLYDTHYEISGKPPTPEEGAEEPRQAISLIDLDDAPTSTTSSTQQSSITVQQQQQQQQVNVFDELSDIFGTSATISTPPTQPQQSSLLSQQQQQQQRQLVDPLAFLNSTSTPSPAQTTSSSLAVNTLPPPPIVSPTLSSSSMGTPSASYQQTQESLPAPANNGNIIKHDPGK